MVQWFLDRGHGRLRAQQGHKAQQRQHKQRPHQLLRLRRRRPPAEQKGQPGLQQGEVPSVAVLSVAALAVAAAVLLLQLGMAAACGILLRRVLPV